MTKDGNTLSLGVQYREVQKRTEMLISVRDRSEYELKERLARAGFDDVVVKKELARVRAVGLVDDERFIQLYISGKKRSGWGQNRIENELKRFGIELNQQEGYPEKFFNKEEEFERALSCLSKFKTNAQDKRSACYKKLISKGFSIETIYRVIASYYEKASFDDS